MDFSEQFYAAAQQQKRINMHLLHTHTSFTPSHKVCTFTGCDHDERLADAARAAVQSPEVRRRIENEGATPVGNSPEEFARFVDSEIVRWRAVVQYAGAKPE